ncbi:MAG: hypothetical protein AAGA87_17540 [Pseudomonadota bacterium]
MFEANVAVTKEVYRANDPAQTVYRSLLEAYSDAELAEIEDEIGAFSRTGMLLPTLEDLLTAGGAIAA